MPFRMHFKESCSLGAYAVQYIYYITILYINIYLLYKAYTLRCMWGWLKLQ